MAIGEKFVPQSGESCLNDHPPDKDVYPYFTKILPDFILNDLKL